MSNVASSHGSRLADVYAARLIAMRSGGRRSPPTPNFDNYRPPSTVSRRTIDAKSVLSPMDGPTDRPAGPGRYPDVDSSRPRGRAAVRGVGRSGPVCPCCIIQDGERAWLRRARDGWPEGAAAGVAAPESVHQAANGLTTCLTATSSTRHRGRHPPCANGVNTHCWTNLTPSSTTLSFNLQFADFKAQSVSVLIML